MLIVSAERCADNVELARPMQKNVVKKRGAGRPPSGEVVVRREAILDAATKVFLELGFERASTDEIARRSGTSKQTLYSLFPSKAALFERLMHRYLNSWGVASLLSTSDHAASSAEQLLQEFGKAFTREILGRSRQEVFRLIVAEAERFPDLAKEFWRLINSSGTLNLKQRLDEMVDEGLLNIENTKVAAEQFLGSLLWATLIRFSLRIACPIRTAEEMDAWIASGVRVFLSAHQPSRGRAVPEKMFVSRGKSAATRGKLNRKK